MEEKGEGMRSVPIWCLDWSPMTPDHTELLLAVGSWDNKITFWNESAK